MPKPHPLMVADLAIGQRYKVQYQIEGVHRVPRMMLATLVEVVTSKSSDKAVLHFSGRPEFGTVVLDKEHIQSMSLFVGTTHNFADRKVK